METVDYAKWLTVNEVVTLVRTSRRTVYNWIYKGKVRAVEDPSGYARIDPDSLFKPSRLLNRQNQCSPVQNASPNENESRN